MDVNHISVADALSGKVAAQPSPIPANPPAQAVHP
jgi:hypothetical protein